MHRHPILEHKWWLLRGSLMWGNHPYPCSAAVPEYVCMEEPWGNMSIYKSEGFGRLHNVLPMKRRGAGMTMLLT